MEPRITRIERIVEKEKILYKDLSYKIIGAAIEVHKELGCGFLESVYDEAFGSELKKIGLNFEYQKELEIFYKGEKLVKKFRVDYIIENSVIVENKAVKGLTEADEAQMHNYLKAAGMRLGIIINYGRPSLEYKRIVRLTTNYTKTLKELEKFVVKSKPRITQICQMKKVYRMSC